MAEILKVLSYNPILFFLRSVPIRPVSLRSILFASVPILLVPIRSGCFRSVQFFSLPICYVRFSSMPYRFVSSLSVLFRALPFESKPCYSTQCLSVLFLALAGDFLILSMLLSPALALTQFCSVPSRSISFGSKPFLVLAGAFPRSGAFLDLAVAFPSPRL